MPKISLRLNDEQHHELVKAAKRNHRSLQNEVVHRLFPPTTQVVLDVLDPETHFKPDPKPEKKR